MSRQLMTEEERLDREQARDSERREQALRRIMAAQERRARRHPCVDCGAKSDGFRYKDAPHYLCRDHVIERTVAALEAMGSGGTSA